MAVRCTLHLDPTLTFDVLTGGKDLAAAAGRERTGKKDGQERGATSSPAGAVLVGPSIWAAALASAPAAAHASSSALRAMTSSGRHPSLPDWEWPGEQLQRKKKGQSSTISTVGQPAVGNNRNLEPELVIHRGELNNEANTSEQGGGKDIEDPGTGAGGDGEQNKNARQKPATGDAHWSDNKERGKTTRDDNVDTLRANTNGQVTVPHWPTLPWTQPSQGLRKPVESWVLGSGVVAWHSSSSGGHWPGETGDGIGQEEPSRDALHRHRREGRGWFLSKAESILLRRPPYGIICRVLSVTAVWRWS
ncbi:hypothetical protein CSOJ01_07877 [Colletotrichum sojae]|uniref:Uncharacterized protein n=1 Tax=Colletotrichum sojae TaxID=2175907 RepID=A0A8H6MSW6_9PEZI|nr:hypothetical protein CSOJ01_07877 [Colletotrichum sojae]